MLQRQGKSLGQPFNTSAETIAVIVTFSPTTVATWYLLTVTLQDLPQAVQRHDPKPRRSFLPAGSSPACGFFAGTLQHTDV
jgi:hypothetical protein